MFVREISEPVTALKGAGGATEKLFAKIGVFTIGDLLCRYPRDWEDRTKIVPLKDFREGKVCTSARVLAHSWFGNIPTLKVFIEDDTARAALICFNRPFLEKTLAAGREYLIYGTFSYQYGEIQSSAFDYEPLMAKGNKKAVFGKILPIYPLTENLRMGTMRSLVRAALEKYSASIEDELPQSIRERYHLFSKAESLNGVHFPDSSKTLEKAKKTIIYEELFYLEIMVGKRAQAKRGLPRSTREPNHCTEEPDIRDTEQTVNNAERNFRTEEPKSRAEEPDIRDTERTVNDAERNSRTEEPNHRTEEPSIRDIDKKKKTLQKKLLERLPFSLTQGQRDAVEEINRDMESPYPMARLLQGDVGSGKTLVAFLAALKAIELGGQAAIMAPTELLARQHAENAAKLLEPLGITVAFLTGNIKSSGRGHLLKNLAEGEVDLIIGTHALFSHDTIYRALRLVVIDEQHRFGVIQRQTIMAKGRNPDLLMMSATPIPRTLAITVFGDLDVSVIRDLPPGRKPIATHLARESNEGKVYDFVRERLKAGEQAYFVYPLIEEGELELKDAVSMAERLGREVFPEYTVALAHSKLDEEEKRLTMEAFRKGEIRILTATSVVEVGVDVPNASCMVIEHAERFGLSALHQLRGRVGRGVAQSYCFLVYSDKYTEDAKTRLMVMLENSDGFVIAEEDLKIRGPGQIVGVEQSGYLKLGLADPVENAAILEKARADAFALLESDPGLLQADNRRIAEVLTRAPPFADAVF